MALNLEKELARLAKIDEKREAILDPSKKKMRTGGVKTLLSEAEKIQRQQERARKDFVKWVMSEKNRVLSEEVEDYTRIIDILPISHKGIQEAEEVLSTYDEEKAKLEAQLFLLEQKKKAAENDIDLLNDAVAALDEFNEAVKAYALSCIEQEEEFSENEIIELWENMMPQRYIDALNRGTTSFGSLDYLYGSTLGEFSRDPEGAKKALAMKVARLFEKYDISEVNTPDMEGI